jgi:hypothetical protein
VKLKIIEGHVAYYENNDDDDDDDDDKLIEKWHIEKLGER